MIIHVGKQPPPLTPAASLCPAFRRAAGQIQRRPIFLPTTVTRFLFLFSQQSRARKKPPQKSPPPPKYRPFFNHTFRPHLVLDSSAFSAATAINCCPRERRVPSFSAHAKHPFARDSPSKPPLEREREARPREITRGARDPLQLRYPSFRFNDSFLSLPFY